MLKLKSFLLLTLTSMWSLTMIAQITTSGVTGKVTAGGEVKIGLKNTF